MSEMNKMQKPLQIIDEMITIFNIAQMDQNESKQNENNEITSPPKAKKAKVDHTTNDTQTQMDIDNDNNDNDIPSDHPTFSSKTSYPLPPPNPRRRSNSKPFSPQEYEMKNNDSDDQNVADLEASISALPPLVAPKSKSDTNLTELWGFGCIDPLLYASNSTNSSTTKNDDDKMEVEEDEIIKPTCIIPAKSMKFNFNDIAANYNGAILWQRDCNGIMGWGDNEDGNLGDGVQNMIKSPRDMRPFRDRPVRFVSVGEKHTAAILTYGGLYAFGCNENGQCGLNANKYFRVKPDVVVPGCEQTKMCQVACGSYATLALTRDGTLYSFGNKDVDGLLGRSNFVRWPSWERNVIPSMYFYPITEIVCGEKHCLLRTRCRRIFGFGRNNHGQLGLGDTKTRKEPTEIVSLTQKNMIQIECGASHSCVLMKDGEIWCFGNNNFGQCGQNPKEQKQVLRPQKVEWKWEQTISQIACGLYHTLCTNGRKIWTFGQNLQGQCTGNVDDGAKIWKPFEIMFSNDANRRVITKICGTNFSSLVLTKVVDQKYVISVKSLRKLQPMDLPLSITFNQLNELCSNIENGQNDMTYLQSLLITIFKSPSCLNQSFMSNVNCYKDKFGTGIDFEKMTNAFHRILEISDALTNRLRKSLLKLARRSLEYIESAREACNLRFYFLILAYPGITNPGFNHEIMKSMNELIRRIKNNKPLIFKQLTEWIASWPLKTRSYLLNKLQECMTTYLEVKSKCDHYIAFICDPLKLFHDSNELQTDISQKIPFEKFYNRALTRNGYLDFKNDYYQWANPNSLSFSFCDYPFLLDPVAKRNILKIEKDLCKQYHGRPNFQTMFMGIGQPFIYNPFFVISVRRNHVLNDSLNAIVRTTQTSPNDFYKELKIIFDGEEGVDQGGVRKEFFQLIIRECFDVKYGTFVYNEETRNYWFNKNSVEQPKEYMLLGIIIGLAIYNGVLLDVHFPPVVYKKMCNQKVDILDLNGYDPAIYNSVQQILSYKGDVKDLCLTFSVDTMVWDKLETTDLMKDGRNIEVCDGNKAKYIELLTNYYLNDSVKSQFDAFLKGFRNVLKGKAFDMIQRGEELELLICGNQTLDFDALEVSCKYEGGYNSESKVIRWFWDILHEFGDDEKKKFLKFFSGSDRAPLRGLGKLGMLVQKATADGYNGKQLPTAHTCFNALLLPAYATKRLMQEKLLAAIKYSEGFGLK